MPRRGPTCWSTRAEALEEDFAVAGPIQVELHVATSGTDADWIVKLIDVYPDDYPDPAGNAGRRATWADTSNWCAATCMRGKFRNSFEKPEPFSPGQPAALRFTMQDVCHTFRPGHRLMVQVQSTWFPLVDRNPQTFVDIYTAKESDFHKAVERVYRSVDRESRLTVLTLP